MNSCLYEGRVMHDRLRPSRHRFSYRFTSWFIDLDELPLLDCDLWGFSYNRPGLFSLWDADFGPGRPAGLKAYIQQLVEAQGRGRVERVCLLCQPRCLGYIFNSLSVYFCYGSGGRLVATLYEVTNTYRERHLYLTPADDRGPLRQQADKKLYVSPFMEMDCRYRFDLHPPAEAFRLVIRMDDRDGALFNALWQGARAPLDARALRRALWRPPMTLKTIVAIHWEALKLWRKGTPVVRFKKTERFQVSLGRWQEGV